MATAAPMPSAAKRPVLLDGALTSPTAGAERDTQPSQSVTAALPAVIAKINRGKGFANGRSVRSLVEQMVARQSLRLAGPDVNIDTLPEDQLTLLTVDDLPGTYRPGSGPG